MSRTTTNQGPDPRWGMLAPVVNNGISATPGGLVTTYGTSSTAALTDTNNPFSIKTLTEQDTINGRTYTSSYDGATRTYTDRSPEGRQSTTTIDKRGRLSAIQPAGLLATNFEYDAHGRLKSATQGSGVDARTVLFGYNAAGELQTITNTLGYATRFEYDPAGRVKKQILPDGHEIRYDYDASGNLKVVTPPGQPAHTFDYTAIDQTASYTPPAITGTGPTTYTYNTDRQLKQVQLPDKQTINLGYDNGGRLNTLTTARGTSVYTYTPTTGTLAAITAPDGIGLTFTYDGSLLKSETWHGPVTGSISYTYDTDFRVKTTSVDGTNPIAYQYDRDSLLKAAGSLALQRDSQNGLLVGTTLGGITDTLRYNGFAEPITYTAAYKGNSLYTVSFKRDKLGRIQEQTETIDGTTTTYSYTYYPVGQLKEVKQNGVVIASYTYDSNGNRLTGPGLTTNASYDTQDRLNQYGNTTYTYKPNGELAGKTQNGQTTLYQYDALGNLTAVTLPDGRKITYLIDGRNRRIGKQVNGTLVQRWLYDGQLRPVAELDGAGNIVSRFVYATHVNVPDYMIKAGVTYRIITDQLGSPRLVINTADGSVVQRMDYDAWGVVLQDTNPGFQPFGFAGGLYDRDTKLVRFGARDYDAEVGRWTAKDPISFAGGDVNLYSYVENDPINLIDLRGTASLNTISLRTFMLIMSGDIEQAGEYYLLETGRSELPPWFTAMQQAFSTANQVAGRCETVAKDVAEGFRKLGQNPQIIKVFGDGRFLSWQGQKVVSDNNFHVAVMNGDKIFDAYTGSAGMTWAEYQVSMQTLGELKYTVLP